MDGNAKPERESWLHQGSVQLFAFLLVQLFALLPHRSPCQLSDSTIASQSTADQSHDKTFLSALLDWEWFDPGDLFDFESIMGGVGGLVGGLVALAGVAAVLWTFCILFYGFFAVTYQLIVDPDAVNVAARLDSLSINPDRYFPRF